MLDVPGVTLYPRDERCPASFCLTVGRLSGERSRPEAAVRSPLGTFVERFTRLPVPLVDATGGRREFTCRLASPGDGPYVAAPDLVTCLARRRPDRLTAYSGALSRSGAHEVIVARRLRPGLRPRPPGRPHRPRPGPVGDAPATGARRPAVLRRARRDAQRARGHRRRTGRLVRTAS